MPEDSEGSGGITESVLPSSTSDQPTLRDELGFEPYVRALASFLTHPQTQGPLAVSIEGDWGSGKSSFMLQLEEEIPRRSVEADPGRPPPLIVRFNAWRHEKDEALWAAFALHFTKDISLQQPFLQRSRCHVKLFLRRFGWREGWPQAAQAILFFLLFAMVAIAVPVVTYGSGWRSVRQFAGLLVPTSEGETSPGTRPLQVPLAPGVDSGTQEQSQPDDAFTKWNQFPRRFLECILASGGFLGYAAILILIWSRLSRYLNPFEIDLKKYLESPDYKDKVSFIERFHEDFSKVVAALAGNRTVFVFIDDLDRCEVPRAADLMQALNLMISENPRLIFILGMDREKVAAGLAVKNEKSLPYLLSLRPSLVEHTEESRVHRGLEYGYEFIEKFVQVPFLVPKPTRLELAQLLRNPSLPPSLPSASARFAEILRRWWFGRQWRAIAALQKFKMQTPQREAIEKRRERIRLLATEDSPAIRAIVLSVAPALDNNPRRLKQFMNLFRLRTFIAAETGLFDPSEGPIPEQELTLQQLGKFTALLLRWPLLVSELDQDPKLLANLEDLALTGDFHSGAGRWSGDDGLRSLLREGCVSPAGKPTEDSQQWRIANLKVDRLLQVSPRVRFVTNKAEATLIGSEKASGSPEAPTPPGAGVSPSRRGPATTRNVNAAGKDYPAPSDSAESKVAPGAPVSAAEIFAAMPGRFNKEGAKGLKAVFQFNLTGEGGGSWHVIIDNDRCEVRVGAHPRPNITISMTAQDYVDMTTGKLDGQKAFMESRLRIAGDMGMALRMQSLFT